jgi:CheY-like chemotaxis protein
MVVRAFLESLGFECIEADNGLDAVMMAELFHPDVIFMDIMMPGMNGIEAFKRIRANPKSAHIAIIALTASGSVSTKKELLALGFDDYITKPYRERWLIHSLEQVAGICFIKGEIEQKPLKESYNGYLTEAINWFFLQQADLREPLMDAFELQSFETIKRLIEPLAHTSSIANYILQQARQDNHLFFISLSEKIAQL